MTTKVKNSFLAQLSPLLEGIENPEKQQKIERFWRDEAVPYFTELHDISEGLNADSLDYETATERTLKATQSVLLRGAELEKALEDEELTIRVKNFFRLTGAPYGLASKAVRHAFEKPGGYPGDYELLEFIYNNVPTSDRFGHCADMVFLKDDYARAVRSRKDSMKVILTDFFNEKADHERNVLNIACGASRELRELFSETSFTINKPITFHMIDKSQEALAFSEKELQNASDNISFQFINNSVYDYIKEPEKYTELLKGQDLVYSIGLADYIPAKALGEQVKFFYNLLNPGGRFIIAHKDSRNYLPLTPDWWADWTFYLRDEDEVIEIIKSSGIENYTLTVEREANTNIIFFLQIVKR